MDKVKLVQDERLDIPDATGLQDLVYEYVARSLGALLELRSGCLSLPDPTTAVKAGAPEGGQQTIMTFGACVLYQSTAAGSRAKPEGYAIRYDPADPNQTQDAVDLGAYAPAVLKPWVWARWVLADSDVDTRRRWSVGTASEVAFATETRSRQTVAFVASETQPAEIAGGGTWFPIGRIVGWGIGTKYPKFQPLTVWDEFDITSDPGDGPSDAGRFLRNAVNTNPLSPYPGVGLGKIIRGVLSNMAYLHDSDDVADTFASGSHDTWDMHYKHASYNYGLKQLHDRVYALEESAGKYTGAGVIEGAIDEAKQAANMAYNRGVLASGLMKWHPNWDSDTYSGLAYQDFKNLPTDYPGYYEWVGHGVEKIAVHLSKTTNPMIKMPWPILVATIRPELDEDHPLYDAALGGVQYWPFNFSITSVSCVEHAANDLNTPAGVAYGGVYGMAGGFPDDPQGLNQSHPATIVVHEGSFANQIGIQPYSTWMPMIQAQINAGPGKRPNVVPKSFYLTVLGKKA